MASQEELLEQIAAVLEEKSGGSGGGGGRYGEIVYCTYISDTEIEFEFPFENCIGFDIDTGEYYTLDITPGKFSGNLVVELWYPFAPEKHASPAKQNIFGISFINSNGSTMTWYSKNYLPSNMFELYVYENKVRLVSHSYVVFTGGNYRLLPVYSD